MQRVLTGIAALAIAGLGAFFVMGLSPRAEMLPDTATVIEAGDSVIDASGIKPYSATYSTTWKVMGINLESGSIGVGMTEADSGLAITFDFGNATDSMLVNRVTLAPIRRNIPGQRLTFEGRRMTALVMLGDSTTERTMQYPGQVFEVSILDLVALAAAAAPPFQLGWPNFADEAGWLASVRETGAETLSTPAGQFETRIFDIGFADGKVRRYWMADRAPYKIKQKTFDRGEAIVYSWNLETFEVP